MCAQIVIEQKTLIKTIPSAIQDDIRVSLLWVSADLAAKQIVFIGNGPSGWRGWYKGLDLFVESVMLAGHHIEGLSAIIVGSWDDEYRWQTLQNAGYNDESPCEIRFVGYQTKITNFLSESSLYVHLGRGEAFGISVIEAMLSGLPAIVSECTGACEAVEQVDRRFVVPLDPQEAANRILWYVALTFDKKVKYSEYARSVASTYIMERACESFRNSVYSFY